MRLCTSHAALGSAAATAPAWPPRQCRVGSLIDERRSLRSAWCAQRNAWSALLARASRS